jgi:hypothetical protein
VHEAVQGQIEREVSHIRSSVERLRAQLRRSERR